MVCNHIKHPFTPNFSMEFQEVHSGKRERPLLSQELVLIVRIVCSNCQTPYVFKGLQAGFSTVEPTASYDHSAIRCPIVPPEDSGGERKIN